MKKLSLPLLADAVITRRKGLKMTQAELAKRTGMNRSMLSKLETQEYTPSISQLQTLAEVLRF
jgi:UDPglucose 6-dehydrogenase